MDSRIIRVVLIYAVFASGWILFSDLLVTSVLSDPQAIHRASTVKGWVFVGVTSLLLWGLLRRLTQSGAAGVAPAEPLPGLARWRSLVLPLVLLSIGVVALGYLSVLFIVKQHRAEEYRRIEAIADLKVGQLAMWVNERQSDALVIERNAGLRELLARWQRDNDGRAQASLLSAIEAIRGTYRYAQAALVDALHDEDQLGPVQLLGGQGHLGIRRQTGRVALHAGPAGEYLLGRRAAQAVLAADEQYLLHC